MTIAEIKDLTKFLSDEDVEKIKEEIKNKETVLKSGNLNEEELVQVLNTLFAILVIEKTLESEIEGIEEMREELESELMEAYDLYDSYMTKYKKEDKKKKKRWLLNFLFLSENIRSKKDRINISNKTIDRLQKELNTLKQEKADANLRNVVDKYGDRFDDFCKRPDRCRNPMHHHPDIKERMERRAERILNKRINEAIREGREPRVAQEEIKIVVKKTTEGIATTKPANTNSTPTQNEKNEVTERFEMPGASQARR